MKNNNINTKIISQKLSLLVSQLEARTTKSTLAEVKETIQHLNIHPQYPIILVAGTNGKGSVCAYISQILMNANLNVGVFTSPHLFKYNERIAINNQMIEDEVLCTYLEELTSYNLSLFQTFTLVMHKYFMQQNIDIAVIEVGIGGLLDVTNLFDPAISVITSIDLDHKNILGDTIEAIGLQKAGIYRKQCPAFLSGTNIPNSVIEYANSIQAYLHIINHEFKIILHEHSFDVLCMVNCGTVYNQQNSSKNQDNIYKAYYTIPYPKLRGDHQIANAALSIAVINQLQSTYSINLSAIKNAVSSVYLGARFEIISYKPQIILDVAHNPDAVLKMCHNLLKLPFVKHCFAIFGVCNDKDVQQIINISKEYINKWWIAPINSSRSCDTATLYKHLLLAGVKAEDIHIKNSIQESVADLVHYDKIHNIDPANLDDYRIIAFGSFLVAEEVSLYLNTKV